MSTPSIETIKNGLKAKSDDELLNIWISNDQHSWTEDAFQAIKEILIERKLEIPIQNTPITEPNESSLKSNNTKYGIACILGGVIVFLLSLHLGSTLILPYGIIGFGILILTKEFYT